MSFDVLKSSLSSAIFMYQQLTYSYTLARVDFQLKSIFRLKNSNYMFGFPLKLISKLVSNE